MDEVLAVGDIEFQKRCLGKMQEVSESGRTIVFVSHQMNQIRRLCERVIWVDGGQLQRDGSAKEIVNAYEVASLSVEKAEIERTPRLLAFHSWYIENNGSNRLDLDQVSGPSVIRFQGFAKEGVSRGIMVVILRSHDNTILWSGMYPELRVEAGIGNSACRLNGCPCIPGIYTWDTRFHDGHRWLDHVQVPELSIVSETDTDIFDYLKGPLNLDVNSICRSKRRKGACPRVSCAGRRNHKAGKPARENKSLGNPVQRMIALLGPQGHPNRRGGGLLHVSRGGFVAARR